jgi:hypothetical protein
MRRLLFIVFGVGILLSGGCIDLTQTPERECLEDRRCGPTADAVCGEDGVEYGCASIAECYGVVVDPSGEACGAPIEAPTCPELSCDEPCPAGRQVDDDGCETCECTPTTCRVTSCEDEPGFVPCPAGTESAAVGSDEQGCPVCDCRPIACELSEANEACRSIYCGSPRAECFSADEDVACPGAEPQYHEPAPQCVCAGSECLERECSSDDQCQGAEGLCVSTPAEQRQGFCVSATCEDLVDEFDQIGERHATCQSDADCRMHRAAHQCCAAYAVNRTGVELLGTFDEFVARTSCAEQFTEACGLVDCDLLPTEPEHSICVDGQCEWAP